MKQAMPTCQFWLDYDALMRMKKLDWLETFFNPESAFF